MAATPALPRPPTAGQRQPSCDLCGTPLERRERRRLVWASNLYGDLILAELCVPCASQADRLLKLYGARGSDAVTLSAETVSSVGPAKAQQIGGMLVRGLIYVLVAVAAFAVFTLVTSRG
jgi:hypothetical protein